MPCYGLPCYGLASPTQQMQEAHHQEAQTDRASLPHWAQWQQNAKGIKLCAIKQYLPCRKMICSRTLEKYKLFQQDRGSRDDQNGSTAARCSESCMFFIRLQRGTLHECAIAAGFLLILYVCMYMYNTICIYR